MNRKSVSNNKSKSTKKVVSTRGTKATKHKTQYDKNGMPLPD